MSVQRPQAGPGQESVWDYPRPPRIEDSPAHIQVVYGGIVIADTTRAKRVLETSHPPVYYIPPQDLDVESLIPTPHRSWCEFKGEAHYYTLSVPGKTSPNAAWYYPRPTPRCEELEGYVAFYPSRVDACYVDDERVAAQEGDFYGGWITSNLVGPFKGGPGTFGW